MSNGKPEFDQVTGRGFGLLELIVVIIIMVVLTAAAAPIYRGYVLDAKAVEAKLVAASLWTALTEQALAGCGTGALVSAGYTRAGLSSTGTTTPARWAVTNGGSNSITMDCGIGTITPDGDVFTVSGSASDISPIRVKLTYLAARTSPVRLRCSIDGGNSFADC
jgi:prepilin-type N-terminal cleavage/methylation domain-containing protein